MPSSSWSTRGKFGVSKPFIETVLESGANGGHVPLAPREIGANQTLETREQMRAVSRLGKLLLAGALALAPWAALAQEAPAATSTSAPPADTVGPRELQNFSLNGTITRPADQLATAQPAPQTRRQPAPAPTESTAAATRADTGTSVSAPRPAETASAATPLPAQPQRAPQQVRQPTAAPALASTAPDLGGGTGSTAATASPPAAATFAPDPTPAGTLAPEHKFPILPWLLAALVLGAGGAFLFFRNRGREAFAGGPQIDAFVAPTPAPAQAPRPAPAPAAAAPKPAASPAAGIVSTRLRPWIDIGFNPLRCVVEDDKVTVDFEIELFNSGSAPARAVLAEASLFNAGPVQDQQISSFFANPVGAGERIVAIPPLQRVAMRTQVFAPRDQVQLYELGGHQVFVPLIAFNALYKWSGGEGQTSASYLLGRDTKGEKMGPFRLDLGPHIFRGVAARLLPAGVRQ